MAGALKRRTDRGYISTDPETRLRRYQSNLQHIFDKYENCEDDADDTEVDLCDLSVLRGRSHLINKKTKDFGHSKLKSTPREGDLCTRDHAHKRINPFNHRQNQEKESFQQQRPDLHGTYVLSKPEDPWDSHGNLLSPLSYDKPDSMGSQPIPGEDHMEADPYPDDISRIQSLNETYKDVLSQLGPDLEEDISDAETLITTSESEDSSDEDMSEPSSSSGYSEDDQPYKTRETKKVHHSNLQESPRMESYFASSEDSSGYHSSELPSCVYDRSRIHKQYRCPQPQISYRQVEHHLMSGDKELVRVKRPDYRHQIQNLYQMCGRGDMMKSEGNLDDRHERVDTQTIHQRSSECERIRGLKEVAIYRNGSGYHPKKDSHPNLHQGNEKILIQGSDMKRGNAIFDSNTSDLYKRSSSAQKGQQTVFRSRRTVVQTECSKRRNSLCLEDFESLSDTSQNMIRNGLPEYSKKQLLKEGTLHLNNQPMSSIEKVTKWMMPSQESEDKYQVKAKRKLVIHPVSEVNSEPSFSVADNERQQKITEELSDFDQKRNSQENNKSELNIDGNSMSCYGINCSCRERVICSCADCMNVNDMKLCQQLGCSHQHEIIENGNLSDERGIGGASQTFVRSLSPEKSSSTLPFPGNQTSTDISPYPSSPGGHSTFFSSPRARSKCFQSPRAQSYPSSPQNGRSHSDVSNSPSSSFARLHLSSPRSSPRISNNFQQNFNTENNSCCHTSQSVPPVFKVPNAFPYQKSPSTKRGIQRSCGNEGNIRNNQFGMREHVRSSSCDSWVEHRRGSASNCIAKLNYQPRDKKTIHNQISENVLRHCSYKEYQQDKMEVGVPCMQKQDLRRDNIGEKYYEQEPKKSRQKCQPSRRVHESSKHECQPCKQAPVLSRQVFESPRQRPQPSEEVNKPPRQELQMSRQMCPPSTQEFQQSSSYKLQSVRKWKPKCSLFPPENQNSKSTFFQRSFSEKKDTCQDRDEQWTQNLRQSSRNQPRYSGVCVLQSTPRKPNSKPFLDSSFSTINPSMDNFSDEDEVSLI
ncbi:uncharacterized protein LOC133191934 [Saccostrea echinata]|uniref:uncharacterized protein LOC133191934 n=1 Tax=Saccostrea echinata TaxID=191078 RepID=UPI002A7F0678|nr:uncharacterized protein LOC133191934 [Saccostrea echinata]